MKIALNTFPLNSLHAGRGIGHYTSLLLDALIKYDNKNEYVNFSGTLTEKVDIVHYPFFDIFQPTLQLFPNTKTVVTIHDLIPLKYPDKFPSGIRGKFGWWRQKNGLKKVDAIITDSDASARDIHAIADISRDKIHVVPLAISPEYKKLTANEINKLALNKYGLPKDFLLYVGDVNWNKNIPGLVKSFAKLIIDRAYSNFQLVLVGSSFLKGELKEVQEINNIIKNENLEGNICKLGCVPTNELVGIFNLAKVYVQPSFDEGFGLTVLEALACGTFVVSSNKGSLPEVAGKAAEYFNPNSANELKDVLKKILDYPESERRNKIQLGLRQAAMFTSKKFAEQTIHVYGTLG